MCGIILHIIVVTSIKVLPIYYVIVTENNNNNNIYLKSNCI